MGKTSHVVCLCLIAGLVAFAKEGGGVRVGTASGLQLADFDKESGAPSWQLKAREAAPEGGSLVNVDDTAVWLLREVTIKSFSRGKPFLTVETPECRYSRPDKTASGRGAIALRGDLFDVRGADWDWKSSGTMEVVRIRRAVTVTLRPGDRPGSSIFISGGQLTATMDKLRRETKFVFTNPDGQVTVQMQDAEQGNAFLKSDTLTVELNAGREEIGGIAAASTTGAGASQTSLSKKELEALDTITASGNVRLDSQSRTLSGDTAVYARADHSFTLRGRARVEDAKQQVTVEGGRIFYRMRDGTAQRKSDTVVVTDPGAGAPRPVRLTVPSFTVQEPGHLARITGLELAIELHRDKNVIQMKDQVHGEDVDFQMDSEFLEVETPHESGLFQARTAGHPEVNRIVARERVRVVHEGRVLTCGTAVIVPAAETVHLSGQPVVAVPQTGAQLTGDEILLENRERRVTVTATPAESPARQRVAVSLPPMKSLAAQRADLAAAPSQDTTITSDRLVMTQGPELATFDFTGAVVLRGVDLQGSCQRLQVLAEVRERALRPDMPDNLRGAARIQSVVATGAVSLESARFKAEGGRADIYPQAVIVENSAQERTGLDGREPKFITLAPDASTPGERPRLTMLSPDALGKIAPGPAAGAGGTGAASPVTITSDLMEIVSGQAQDRFFLRGNVLLNGKDIRGACDTVEGRIVAAAGRGRTGDRQVTEILGRGGVVFEIEDKRASGEEFRMMPAEMKVFLSGSPRVRDGDGVEAVPGKQIVYDWKTGNWQLEGDAPKEGRPVIRPSITIPLTRRPASLP